MFGLATLLPALVEGAASLLGYSFLDLGVLWEFNAPAPGISRLRYSRTVCILFIAGPSIPPW
jgi:hypothetical protein